MMTCMTDRFFKSSWVGREKIISGFPVGSIEVSFFLKTEKLTGQKLEVREVTQSEEAQRNKLQVVLGSANQILGLPRWSTQKWSVESIHSKSLVAILHLLVNLARHFRAPLRLPENVSVETVVVKVGGMKGMKGGSEGFLRFG